MENSKKRIKLMKSFYGIVVLVLTLVIFGYAFLLEGPSSELKNGEEIVLTGMISDTPWQHMISMPESHPVANYFDFNDGDQVVIYTRVPVNCEGELEIRGDVIKVEGESKKPDSDELYSELQIKVDEMKCLN